MASPTVFDTSAAHSSVAGQNASIALPASLADDDVAYLVVGYNNSASVTIDSGDVITDWTLEEGPLASTSNNLTCYLFSKTLTAAESGATVTAHITSSVTWLMGCVVVRDGVAEAVNAGVIDSSNDGALEFSAFTPANDDDLVVAIAGFRTQTSSVGITPPGDYVEELEDNTTSGTSRWGSYVMSKTLTGQSGTPQSAPSATYPSTTARDVSWIITLSPVVAAGVTGTLDATLDGVSLAAVGDETIAGDLASTLEGAEFAAAGQVDNPISPITGTLAATLDGVTFVATGLEEISGTLGSTLEDATLSAAAEETFAGDLAATLDGAELDVAGLVANPVTGTLDATLDDVTFDATGTAGATPPVDGTLAATLDDVTLDAAGAETMAGDLAATLDGATFAATGLEEISGTLGSTLEDATLSAAAEETFAGELVATLDDATLTVAAVEEYVGTLAATLDGVTLASSAEERIEGTLAATLDDVVFDATDHVEDVTHTASLDPAPYRSRLVVAPYVVKLDPPPYGARLGRPDTLATLDPPTEDA